MMGNFDARQFASKQIYIGTPQLCSVSVSFWIEGKRSVKNRRK